jgi:cellulose synthase operon protein C
MSVAQDIAQIAARLLGGESFDSLMRSLLPKPERELLKYCASVRTFNEQMLDEFFRPNVSGGDKISVPFSKLREHSFVQSIPGSSDFFQLREDSRQEYFNLWHVDSEVDVRVPPKLRSLSKKLVSYYQSLGEGSELDVLYQQIVADSKEAERLFNTLYNAADNEFDLGRCQDLIKILEARHTILDSNLRDLHADRHNYLKSRSFWSKEYYQTVFYYETAQLGARFDELLNDNSKWIMQLYAPGGRGKTMFLRWLTARRCAPEPARIPCAKIDFDLIDPVAATRNPWMLLLEIAQQLNEQIPGNLFGEQLGDLKEFRPVLTRSDRSQRTLSDFESRLGADELQEIPDRFVQALKAARLKKKVVVIFDTLEEVILYQGTDMMALLQAVQKLQEQSDNKICLILSGRYDLNQKLPGFYDAYDKKSQTLELTRFSADDSRKYLQEKRGLDRLVDVVVEKAGGNPFQLALYADILRFSPRLTEKDIREYPTDLLYLIRRVLLRIRNRRVRWLLRYGVIPRKLRLSFVKEVMAPYLPHAMAGASGVDDPEQDIKKELESENAFRKVLKSADQKVNIDRLWNTLNEYASSYSWVSQDEEANTVSFHSDVLNPMRAVLRKQTVYRKLHRAAIRHYEKKAKANPEEWGTWIVEAIYHKFQLDGVDAADYWRRQIEQCAAESQPKWRLDFAREVINLSKADQESSGDGVAGTALVDDKLLAQAYFEVARADADMGRNSNTVDGGDSLWQDARKAFGVYQQFQAGSKKPLVSPARSACVEAALLISGHERTKALTIIKAALKQKAPTKDKIALHIEYAGALSLVGKYKESAKHYRTALLLATKARIKPSSILQIRKDLAHHYELCGNLKEAIQEYKNALKFATSKSDDLAVLELSRRLGEIYLASGQIAKAIELTFGNENRFTEIASRTGGTNTTAVEELMRLLSLTGRLALAMRDPFTALEQASQLRKFVEQAIAEGWHSQTVDRLTGCYRELKGTIAAELMEDSEALDDLEQARLSWNAARDPVGATRCLLHMIDVQLRVAGNVKAARFLLEQAERLGLQRQPDLFIRQELAAAEIVTLMGKSAAGQNRLQKLAARAKQEKWSAKDRATIAVGSMIQRAQTTRSVSLKGVIAAFRPIWPPSARLPLLERSYSCPTPKKAAALATPFAKLLPEPEWHRIDAAVHALKLADALRMVGRKLAPRTLLLTAETGVDERQEFALRELYLVWDRLGWEDETLQRVSTRIDNVLHNFANYRNWCGSVLLEQAERLILLKQFEAAQKVLTDAARYYEGAQAGSLCLARLNELRGRLPVEQNLPRQTRNYQLDKTAVAAVRDGFKALGYARSIYEGLQNRVAVKRINSYLVTERKRLQSAVIKTSGKSKSTKTPSTRKRRASLPPLDHEYAAEFEDRIKLPEHTYALRLRRTPTAALEFKAEFAGGRKTVRKDWQVSDSRFMSLLAAKPGESFSSAFCKAFPEDWWRISQQMAKILLQSTFDKVPPRGSELPHLALDLADPILAGIPWEFALIGFSKDNRRRYQALIDTFYRNPGAETSHVNVVRAIQFALQKLLPEKVTIDGIYGPATYEAVRRFQIKQKLPSTGIADFRTITYLRAGLLRREKDLGNSVLIGQTSSDRQLSSMRGHGSAGTDLRRIYGRAGFKVSIVENPTIRMLAQALKETRPQIIHLCPSMKRSMSSGVYLDFGATESTAKRPTTDHAPLSKEATGESNYFSLSAVGKLLSDFSADKAIRPLLILDVPRPPVTSEAVIQLVLRNAFASEVFRMGSTCGVLATGLMDRRQQMYAQLIVDKLAMKRGPGYLIGELRKIPLPMVRSFGKTTVGDPEALSLLLGPIGSALFTQNPTYFA